MTDDNALRGPTFRTVVRRAAWTTVGAVVLAAVLGTAGTARLARLTLTWVDNSGGTARFIMERRTGTTGTYRPIGTTGTGITTYTDSEIVAGTTYCYRVKAFNASGESGYSNEACALAGSSVEERRCCRRGRARDHGVSDLPRRHNSPRWLRDSGVSVEAKHRHVVPA